LSVGDAQAFVNLLLGVTALIASWLTIIKELRGKEEKAESES
jgi:hypothetical protein